MAAFIGRSTSASVFVVAFFVDVVFVVVDLAVVLPLVVVVVVFLPSSLAAVLAFGFTVAAFFGGPAFFTPLTSGSFTAGALAIRDDFLAAIVEVVW